MIGTTVAWYRADSTGFDGTVFVVGRDLSFEYAASSHSNSCMWQQFSCEIKVRISQFAAKYVKNFRAFKGSDPRLQELSIHDFGYKVLAGDEAGAQILRDNHAVQAACGAGTQLMSVDEIAVL